LLISIGGNQIFRQPLIELARYGTLNLHTALLPKYRGLMPSFWVLKNGEAETGVSVFFVDKGIDTGPILVQKSLRIGDMTQQDLIRVTKELGMEAIVEAVEKIHRGDMSTLPNDDAQSSYFSFPTRQDVVEFRRAGKKLY
jgi:methionyl-tRNA formyltransferase